MLLQVLAREFDQSLIAQYVEVGLDGVQRDELRRFLNPVRGRIHAGDLALHLALRGEAVEQHLGERQLGLRAQQRLRVVVIKSRFRVIGVSVYSGPTAPRTSMDGR